MFWNELDFEKIGADCNLVTNAYYGNPAVVHNKPHPLGLDFCGAFHTYAYEWTPDAIAWFVDGVEIRRETGAAATAYAENASGGMQLRFNLWPGDASFGGNFNPSILPVHQYLDWVQFSSYADGAFTFAWREDFDGSAVPSGWSVGSWSSPKNLSTHQPRNVNFIDGYAVMSLTTDEAVGPAGAMVPEPAGEKGDSGDAGDDEGCSLGGSRSRRSTGFFTALGLLAVALFRRARIGSSRR
jgi:beta-glucanase (GH16 family)